jgi:uncharacterized protein (DUF58 family)
MQRFSILYLLIYSLIFVGLASLNGGLLILAVPLLLYLAAGLLYRPQTIQLAVTRHLSANYISPDEPVEVTVSLTNEGQAIEVLYLADVIPAALTVSEGETAVLTPLAAGETVTLHYTVSGVRGDYRFSVVQVTVSDRLHLFTHQETIPAPGQLLILPEVIRLRQVNLRPRQTRVYSGQIPTQQGGPGVEFFGVREYQPGDPLRWVNSRATARHTQSIFINEFQQERMADIGLILDARQQSNVITAEGSLFEDGVRAAAALGAAFLNANNRVGLFIYGDKLDWTYPGYGKIQRQRILWALAQATPSDSQVFASLDHLPTRLFPARSQLVFISPLLPEDGDILIRLRARGYQLLIISPDPIVFEGKTFGSSAEMRLALRMAQLERALLLDQLRQADIQVLDWPVTMPFEEVAHRALNRAQGL